MGHSGQIWPPFGFGKLAVNSQGGFFTTGIFCWFQESGERKEMKNLCKKYNWSRPKG